MAKLGDDIEMVTNESMAAVFDNLGDLNPLLQHECLTVAQCALLIPALIAEQRSGDQSTNAAMYLQLAFLDIAKNELNVRHPESLLPYSQYLRMMESGMFGGNGEQMPMPTADWLISLDEAERWLATKGTHITFDFIRSDLAKTGTGDQEAPVSAPDSANGGGWVAKARLMALEIYEENTNQGYGTDKDSIAAEIEDAFKNMTPPILSAKGKRLSKSNILRQALTPWTIPENAQEKKKTAGK